MTKEKSDFLPGLLVVDMQYDFVDGSLAVPDAASIIPIVNEILDLPFVVKIASRDWHPPDHVSFAANHKDHAVFTTTTVYSPSDTDRRRPHTQELWPVHCVAGTTGAEFVQGLNTGALTVEVRKGEAAYADSYSAFSDCWKLSETTLPGILKRAGVTDLFLVGLAGDFCVKFTAKDAVDHGYRTWVVKDAVRSVGNEGKEWKEMEEMGIKFLDIKELKKQLSN